MRLMNTASSIVAFVLLLVVGLRARGVDVILPVLDGATVGSMPRV